MFKSEDAPAATTTPANTTASASGVSPSKPGAGAAGAASRAGGAPAPASRSWVQSGLYIMTFPMAMTVGMMLAPVMWLFGGRTKQ